MVDPYRVRDIFRGLDGEWQSAVLTRLEQGPMRSADLRRAVSPALDWRSFINTVTRLQVKGLIRRHAAPLIIDSPAAEIPATGAGAGDEDLTAPVAIHGEVTRERITYELTDVGRSVLALLAEVEVWARNNPDHADRIRRRKH